jgi:hypothetical protein
MTRIETTYPLIRHTPGPWDYDMDYIVAPDPDGRHPDIYVAEIAHSDDEGRIASPQQQDANRRLIAAAPELLEALEAQEMAEWDPEASRSKGYFDRARELRRAAIAKATSQDCDWR